jgi:hypothetical protein
VDIHAIEKNDSEENPRRLQSLAFVRVAAKR